LYTIPGEYVHGSMEPFANSTVSSELCAHFYRIVRTIANLAAIALGLPFLEEKGENRNRLSSQNPARFD